MSFLAVGVAPTLEPDPWMPTAAPTSGERLLVVQASKRSRLYAPSTGNATFLRDGCVGLVPVPLSKQRILAFDKARLPELTSASQAAQPPGGWDIGYNLASWWPRPRLGVPVAGQHGPVCRNAESLSNTALQGF